MQQITLEEASKNLSGLVEAALNGEEIFLLKDNQPVIRLLSLETEVKRRPAKAGSAKGLVWIADDFDAPLEDFKEYME
jgi:antitoxin (DNA-binding transcriptional repressor) of toxin-antitoxin stability system